MLNHFLGTNDGYGTYKSIIASQANTSGTKQLVLVNVINVSETSTFFHILKNNVVVDQDTCFEIAKSKYNRIS